MTQTHVSWLADEKAPTTTDLTNETIAALRQLNVTVWVTAHGFFVFDLPDNRYQEFMKERGYKSERSVTYQLSYQHTLRFRTSKESMAREEQMREDIPEIDGVTFEIPILSREIVFTTTFAISEQAQKTLVERYQAVDASFNVKTSTAC